MLRCGLAAHTNDAKAVLWSKEATGEATCLLLHGHTALEGYVEKES